MAQKANGGAENAGDEQALIISMKLSDDGSGKPEELERMFKLEEELREAISGGGSGEYDGNEIGGGIFKLYIYGPGAARLWEVASPIVKKFGAPAGSFAVIRYGKPGAKEDRVSLPE